MIGSVNVILVAVRMRARKSKRKKEKEEIMYTMVKLLIRGEKYTGNVLKNGKGFFSSFFSFLLFFVGEE